MSDGRPTTGRQPCPFCGGWYELSMQGGGQGFHSMPPCPKFADMDLLDFAVAARQARGIYLDEEVS